MKHNKVIYVSLCFLLCGIIYNILFYCLYPEKYVSGFTFRTYLTEILLTNCYSLDKKRGGGSKGHLNNGSFLEVCRLEGGNEGAEGGIFFNKDQDRGRQMKKVLLSALLIVTLLIAYVPAYASSMIDIDNLDSLLLSSLNDKEVQKLKKQINELSDSEFDKFIVEYLETEVNKQVAKEKLAKLDVQLVVPSTKAIEPLKLDAWELDLSVYTVKRGGDSFHRIIVHYVPSDKETYPASYDAIGITWDPSKANYYSYNVSSQQHSSLKDYSQRNKGIVVFNVYDSRLSVGGVYYDAVYVTPKVSGKWMDFGAKYTHTYLTYNTSVTLNPSLSYTTPGIVSGSLNYNLKISSVERSWQKADTNAVYFK